MGKTGAIVLGAVIIGTGLGVFFSNTYGLAPTGGLPVFCGLAGLVASIALVALFDLLKKRRQTVVPPVAAPATPAPTDPPAERAKP